MNTKSSKDYKPLNVLIITSSAGGGLLQAAVAQEQQTRAEDSDIKIVKKDVLRDWVGGWLGRFCIESWNTAQKRGDVKSQKFFVSFHWLFDYIAWPKVFFHTLNTLLKNDIDRVIDTQTTSTSAIMKAIRLFNKRRSKGVILEKIVVDLPTRKATHFFRPIKLLSKKDKQCLKLRTIRPLLEEGQTADAFWQLHCGMSESEIHYEDVNVRQSFRAFQGKSRSNTTTKLKLYFNDDNELRIMQQTWERGTIKASIQGNHIHFDVPDNARVFTILLGSQPARVATLNYVKNFIEIVRGLPQGTPPVYLFVFCGEYTSQQGSLLLELAEAIKQTKDYPDLLSIILFSFQSDDVIAPLFHRSDATCSRSGGQTAMELMAVSTGEIWIHSETKKKAGNLTLKQLLKGIPVWESESALYLVKLCGAKLVTPEIFSEDVRRIFASS